MSSFSISYHLQAHGFANTDSQLVTLFGAILEFGEGGVSTCVCALRYKLRGTFISCPLNFASFKIWGVQIKSSTFFENHKHSIYHDEVYAQSMSSNNVYRSHFLSVFYPRNMTDKNSNTNNRCRTGYCNQGINTGHSHLLIPSCVYEYKNNLNLPSKCSFYL